MTPIQEKLFSLQDLKYKEFNRKLIPTVNPDTMIGVRIPQLRKLAKELVREDSVSNFLEILPHEYYEENILHVLIISSTKDFEEAIKQYELFLPYMDNWVVTDSQTPNVFKKNPHLLLPFIDEWLVSNYEYTIRFAVFLLMSIFLEEETFDEDILQKVCLVNSNKYYVNMMRAWFFATALAKQYQSTIVYLEEFRLDKWTHLKTIQKARESRRISEDSKVYLKSLKNFLTIRKFQIEDKLITHKE